MCGIAGVRRYGAEPITETMIRTLACSLEHRGNHATGIALANGEDIFVLKDDEPAWKFCHSKGFGEFLKTHLTPETETVLVHTRAATKGSPTDNKNNHPCFDGVTASVHNGMISNDDHLFSSMKLKRVGEVDSDIIRAILDKWGLTKEGIKQLTKMYGSAAIGAVSAAYPGKVLLARCGSPLVLGSTKNHLIWASEKAAIHAAIRPFIKRFGIPMQPNRADAAFITMNNNSAYIFGPEGMEWHDEFETSRTYTIPQYRMHDTYHDKRKQFYKDDKDLPDVVICPNEDCRRAMTIPDHLKSKPLSELECGTCKKRLTGGSRLLESAAS